MTRATPQMRRIAKRLIEHEIQGKRPAKAALATPFSLTDKLRPHLANLVGDGGVRALFARALILATAEIAWLGAVQVNADGDLEGLDPLGANLDPKTFLDGRVVLLAQLLGLLVAFIGPGLTSRLVGEIWPHLPLTDLDFGEEHAREKTR